LRLGGERPFAIFGANRRLAVILGPGADSTLERWLGSGRAGDHHRVWRPLGGHFFAPSAGCSTVSGLMLLWARRRALTSLSAPCPNCPRRCDGLLRMRMDTCAYVAKCPASAARTAPAMPISR